jgi:hypothetical protein
MNGDIVCINLEFERVVRRSWLFLFRFIHIFHLSLGVAVFMRYIVTV